MADRNVSGCHEPTLSEKLSLVVESMKEQTNDLWYIMRETIGNKELDSFSDEDFWRFLLHLVKLIERDGCTDTYLAAGVLELSWRSSLRDCRAGYVLDMFCLKRTNMANWVWNTGFKNIFEISYKDAQYPDPGFREEDIVTKLAITGQLGALELLLRFGATSIYPNDERYMHWFGIVNDLFPAIDAFNRPRLMQQLKESMFSFPPATRRRFMFVIRCLEALSILRLRDKSDSESIEKHRACLRLYFKSIPEPFITSREIISTFERLFRKYEIREIRPEERQYFYRQLSDLDPFPVSKEVEEHFPDNHQPSGPRSLHHLCRCQVRENLRTSRSTLRLPQAIDSLLVSRRVKRYIALREEDMGLHPYEFTPSRLPTPYPNQSVYNRTQI